MQCVILPRNYDFGFAFRDIYIVTNCCCNLKSVFGIQSLLMVIHSVFLSVFLSSNRVLHANVTSSEMVPMI